MQPRAAEMKTPKYEVDELADILSDLCYNKNAEGIKIFCDAFASQHFTGIEWSLSAKFERGDTVHVLISASVERGDGKRISGDYSTILNEIPIKSDEKERIEFGRSFLRSIVFALDYAINDLGKRYFYKDFTNFKLYDDALFYLMREDLCQK